MDSVLASTRVKCKWFSQQTSMLVWCACLTYFSIDRGPCAVCCAVWMQMSDNTHHAVGGQRALDNRHYYRQSIQIELPNKYWFYYMLIIFRNTLQYPDMLNSSRQHHISKTGTCHSRSRYNCVFECIEKQTGNVHRWNGMRAVAHSSTNYCTNHAVHLRNDNNNGSTNVTPKCGKLNVY